MEKLQRIFTQICPDADADSDSLVDDELIDSLDLVSLVAEIMDEFGVKIAVDDITPENFNSLDAMLALIRRLK
ncbi:MAG TPA: acyl carrier protein [Candidatus Galloscillospira excrementavium]|nr:acyl carrier protein [Candidatus Galloscillospira excrementavium]